MFYGYADMRERWDYGIAWHDWRWDLYRDYYDGPFALLWLGPLWIFWRYQ